MNINVILNEQNYIKSFSEIGIIKDSIKVDVPNNLVIREEKYNMIWNGNKFTKGDIIELNEKLSSEFYLEYKFYKYENGNLVYDENKKTEEQKADLERKKEELRQQIVAINFQITEYEKEGFDTSHLLTKKQELMNELNIL